MRRQATALYHSLCPVGKILPVRNEAAKHRLTCLLTCVTKTSFGHRERFSFAKHTNIYHVSDKERRVASFNRVAYFASYPCKCITENRAAVSTQVKSNIFELIRML